MDSKHLAQVFDLYHGAVSPFQFPERRVARLFCQKIFSEFPVRFLPILRFH